MYCTTKNNNIFLASTRALWNRNEPILMLSCKRPPFSLKLHFDERSLVSPHFYVFSINFFIEPFFESSQIFFLVVLLILWIPFFPLSFRCNFCFYIINKNIAENFLRSIFRLSFWNLWIFRQYACNVWEEYVDKFYVHPFNSKTNHSILTDPCPTLKVKQICVWSFCDSKAKDAHIQRWNNQIRLT